MKRILTVILLLALAACASSRGFDRGSLRSQIADQKVITEEDIQKTLSLQPQLPSPFKLAIYFAQPKTNRYYGSLWNWRSEDKDTIIATSDALKSKGTINEAIVINEDIVEGNDNRAIRMAAARAGADAVLIVRGTSDIDRYNNTLGYSYALIVTPLFIPGTVADGLFMVTASMWDVRNQYLYLSSEAEGSARQTRPAVFIEEGQLIKAAKSDALTALSKEISVRLTKLTAK
jgi:hypothetical protein